MGSDRRKSGRKNVSGNPVFRLLAEVYRQLPPLTTCKGLCVDQCDQRIPTSSGERELISKRHGIELLPSSRSGKGKPCPALVEGRCSVYVDRPLICRLYGVADGLICPHGCVPDNEMMVEAESALMVFFETMAATGDDPDMVTAARNLLKNESDRKYVAQMWSRGMLETANDLRDASMGM